MTEVIKAATGKAPAWVALLSSILGWAYSYGHLSATVEHQKTDIATLQRQVGGLYAHIRRLQKWPSRSSEPSMKTDAQ